MTEPTTSSDSGSPPAPRRGRLILLGILVVAFLLRLLYVQGMTASPGFETPGMDALYHMEWAQAVAAGEGEAFLRERHHPVGEASPYFRAPGYIWFLAICLKLGGGSLFLPRLVQCLLGVLTTWLVYRLGRRAFEPVTGLVAAGLAATYWLLLYYDAELLIPTLFVPLTLGGLSLALEALERRGRGGLLLTGLAGLLFGAAAITRPTVLLYMPFLGLLLLWRKGRELGWGQGFARAGLLTVSTIVPILPVALHNAAAGDFTLVSTQGGVNFWIGNNPQSDGTTAVVPGTRANWWGGYQDSVSQAQQAEGRELLASEVSDHYAGRAYAWIGSEPGAFFSLLGRKLGLFWSGHELGNNQPIDFYAAHFNPWAKLLPLRFPELLALGLLGMALALGNPTSRRRALPLAGFVAIYAAGVIAFFVCARFRVPVLPLLMVFAGHALVWLVRTARAGRWDRVGLALVPVLISITTSRTSVPEGAASESQGWYHLGVSEGVRGNGDGAETALRRSLELEPGNVYAMVPLAKRLEVKGELQEARSLLQEALQRDPRRVDALEPLLRILIDTDQLEEAESLAGQAAAGFPQLWVPHHAMGRILLARKQAEAALGPLQRAVELDSTAHAAWLDLGLASLATGRPQQALQALLSARRNLGRAWVQRAEETYRWLVPLAAQQDRARALEIAREYARSYPESRRAQGMVRELEGGSQGR